MKITNEDDVDNVDDMTDEEINDVLDGMVSKGLLIKHPDGTYQVKEEVRLTMIHQDSKPETRN